MSTKANFSALLQGFFTDRLITQTDASPRTITEASGIATAGSVIVAMTKCTPPVDFCCVGLPDA